MGIFKDTAHEYVSRGLPVIPLSGKVPVVRQWSNYCNTLPTSAELRYWESQFPDHNIGMPLGACSGLMAIDIDSYDDRIIQAIIDCLPETPWVRIGKKGCVLIYKYANHGKKKITLANGDTVCDILGDGSQVVLPPSIHPDTNKPYIASGNLYDVYKNAKVCPANVDEIIRAKLESIGVDCNLSKTHAVEVNAFVDLGARDDSLVSIAGLLSMGVRRGEFPLIDALNRIETWVSTYTASNPNDNVYPLKGKQKVVEFLLKDIANKTNNKLPINWDAGIDDATKTILGLDAIQADDVEWSYSQVIDAIDGAIGFITDEAQRLVSIENAIRNAKISTLITPLQEESILQYVHSLWHNMPMSMLRKIYSSITTSTDNIAGTDHTEIAQEVIKELEIFGEIREFHDAIWRYNGRFWEKLTENLVFSLIANNYGHMPAAKKASDHNGIFKIMLRLVEHGLRSVPIKAVNFSNGVLNTEGQLLEHSPAYGLTYMFPFEYKKQETYQCPKFFEFLKSIWGMDDDYAEKIVLLREMMAITMFSLGTSFNRAILLYGLAGSGKSQLMTIVKSLVPSDKVSNVSPYVFSDKFQVTEICNSLLNVCGELANDKYIDSSMFKQITDGAELNGQYKGRQIFKFYPECTHWFSSNHLPRTKDTSEGFTRRWAILTFNRVIPASEKVRDLGDLIVEEEKEQILSWVSDIIPTLSKQSDVSLPKSHYSQINTLSSDIDTVFYWLVMGGMKIEAPSAVQAMPSCFSKDRLSSLNLDELTLKRLNPTPIDVLYDSYRIYCLGQGTARPVGSRKFTVRMKEIGALKGFRLCSPTGEDLAEVEVLGLTLPFLGGFGTIAKKKLGT